MALHNYLVGEVAEDFSDGLLSRRDALAKLARLGLTATAAASLLAACGGGGGDGSNAGSGGSTSQPSTTAPPGSEPPGSSMAIESQAVTFAGPRGELVGAWSTPGAPRGAVLVIHENRGLTPHIRDVVARLAGAGYAALAVDLVSEEGGTEKLGDTATTGALSEAPVDRLLGDLRAGIDEIQRRLPGLKVGVTGFCFGGGMTWSLLDAGEDRLAAAVPFYGPAPSDPDFTKANAAVLGVYAEDDDRVNATRDAAKVALEEAGLTHDIRTYVGTEHAFFNDTRERYNADAALQAWAALLDWFDRYLK